MKIHPLAELFPPMEKEEYADFVKDIKFNGLQDEIVTLDGAILDGRNRFNACKDAGEKPRFKKFDPKLKEFRGLTPFKYVMAKNFYRRSLTTSQKSIILAESQKTVTHDTAETMDALAKGAGISRATAFKANKIVKESPKMAKAVKRGKVSVNKAAKIVAATPKAERKKLDFSGVYLSKPTKPSEPYAPPQADTRSIGEVARDGYNAAMKEPNISSWEGISDAERKSWTAAGEAVKKYLK